VIPRPINDALRAVGARIRKRDPELYVKLRDLRRHWTVRNEGLATYQELSLAWFREHADLRGARILELGGDPRQVVADALMMAGAAEVTSINQDPSLFDTAGPLRSPAGARLMKGDAAALPFANESVDLVVSVAVYEHLLDLPTVLTETWRVLQPGGVQVAFFGPIWSSGRGHHVSVAVDDVEYRHFLPRRNPIPDHGHLLLGEAEMRHGLLHGGLPEAHVEAMVGYIYRGDAINRLFLDDYRAMVEASGFIRPTWRYDRDPMASAVEELLTLRHPTRRDFDVTNAYVAMSKEKA